MKLSGDVTKEERELAEHLVLFENEIDSKDYYSPDRIAQIYVCLAHDWFQLHAEEEGDRLLLKAEKICPGYFKNTMIEQQKEDEDFDMLVKSLTSKLIEMLGYTVVNR